MSMPHGETTGRSRACSTCGAGPKQSTSPVVRERTHPWMHRLAAVKGDPSINVSKVPGDYEAIGPHLVVGYPILLRDNNVLLWVKDIGFPSQEDGTDGLDWNERVRKHDALMVACSGAGGVDGFDKVALQWVPVEAVEAGVLSMHKNFPNELYIDSTWFNIYGLVANGTWMRPPYCKALDFENVRKEMRICPSCVFPEWFLPSLDGYVEIQPAPPAPVLRALSDAAAKPVCAVADMPVALMSSEQLLAELQDVKMPSPFKRPLGRAWQVGDRVVWDAPGSGDMHMLATVAEVLPGRVRIELAAPDSFILWREACGMLHPIKPWSLMADGKSLWIHPDLPLTYGRLRDDVIAPPIKALDVGAPVQWANLTPVGGDSIPPMADDTRTTTERIELDADEESEVWDAFARFMEGFNSEALINTTKPEQALQRLVYLRKKLCRMLE